MEALNNYNISGYKFTVWFFRLMLLFLSTAILLVFVLKINDTVSLQKGELVAANPQSDFKAPFEAQLLKINVNEGQHVRKGDTLLIIQNIDHVTQHARIESLEKKIQSIAILRDDLQKRKVAIEQDSLIKEQKLQIETTMLGSTIRTLDEQYALQKQRLSSSRERYLADEILYKKGMLSKVEYNDSKDAYLVLKENISNLKSRKQQQIAEKGISRNNFNKEQNDFIFSQVELDENDQVLLQTKNDFETQLIQAKAALKHIVVATNNGIINYVFNIRHTSNLIAKGDLLISIAPKNTKYYAKVTIPEKDIQYVKAGLYARLKLDAYYHLEHGILKGKVTYIAERKENEDFYALIDLPELNNFHMKSGYTIHGEIVLRRMPLYRYFIKKIFKNFDKK